ncbi:MAG: response regulator transcription factor [Deltaproteobacteria bacterium]|nr:response regulator transcription factor [Deltaproteobacteria bacterium]
MARILIVEDDPTLALSLRIALANQGHEPMAAPTLELARRALGWEPEVVVLDLGLPDGDGLELCVQLREAGNFVPIVALTARATLEDRVIGLSHGADDYVTKPFDLPELLARIEALLRRRTWSRSASPPAGAPSTARIGRLVIDFGSREATSDGEVVVLSDLEVRFLRYLVENEGQVVTREELLTHVWELPAASRTRSIDTFVYRLRRLLEPDPARPVHLLSVRGAGWRLVTRQNVQNV